FAHKEHPELHSRIFRMEAGDQFAFGFRYVERQPVSLCNASNQERDKSSELRNDIPHSALRFNNINQTERACEKDYTHERKPHEHLIRYHLRSATHGTQQCVLVVRGPSTKDN